MFWQERESLFIYEVLDSFYPERKTKVYPRYKKHWLSPGNWDYHYKKWKNHLWFLSCRLAKSQRFLMNQIWSKMKKNQKLVENVIWNHFGSEPFLVSSFLGVKKRSSSLNLQKRLKKTRKARKVHYWVENGFKIHLEPLFGFVFYFLNLLDFLGNLWMFYWEANFRTIFF